MAAKRGSRQGSRYLPGCDGGCPDSAPQKASDFLAVRFQSDVPGVPQMVFQVFQIAIAESDDQRGPEAKVLLRKALDDNVGQLMLGSVFRWRATELRLERPREMAAAGKPNLTGDTVNGYVIAFE